MRFIDFIRDRARYYNCPVCGRSLRDCELRMLRHVDDRYTVQVTCAACQVQFIVILAIQGEGLEPLTQDELALDVELAEEGGRGRGCGGGGGRCGGGAPASRSASPSSRTRSSTSTCC